MKKKDLEFFKEFLLKRKEAIKENIAINTNQTQALYNSTPSDSIDLSVINTGYELDLKISTNLKQELKDIENSLAKILNNTYGICEYCDENISIERLKVKPHARYCISCRNEIEKGQ